VVRVGQQLPAELSQLLNGDHRAGGIGNWLGSVEAVDLGMLRLEAAQHVVKGTIFKHEHDNVFQGI